MDKYDTNMMRKTIFTTMGVTHFFRLVSFLILKISGWKFTGLDVSKDLKKCVVIAVPHTSNWDFPLAMLLAFSARMPIYWTGKKEIFKPPFSTIMRWMGGIAVDRGKAGGLIESSAEEIRNAQSLYMILQPEGTRQKVKTWKSGFYRIAVMAEVPILLGYLDYSTKKGGFLEVFHPTGNYEEDLKILQEKFVNVKGKHTDKM